MDKGSPAGIDDDNNGTDNVSRSGRVRKKSSLLAGFESLDQLEKGKKRGKKDGQGSREEDGEAGPSKKKKKEAKTPTPKKKLTTPGSHKKKIKVNAEFGGDSTLSTSLKVDLGEGDLEMDLPPDFEGEMPLVEDDSSSSSEDFRFPAGHSMSNKLKSQAQSTYMMEKTNRKSTGPVGPGGKAKTARKDKGSPRITGYTLWVKDQRPMFEKKYPILDHSSLSKRLSEVWQAIPTNQKKMWKNKAAKLMRKNANVMENIKNSGPLPTPKGKKARGRPRVHPLNDEDSGLENGTNSNGKKQKGPSPKVVQRKPNNFLSKEKTQKMSTPHAHKSPKTVQVIKPSSSKTNGSITPQHKKTSPPGYKNHFTNPNTPSTSTSHSNSKQISPRKDEDGFYKVTGTGPMDVAAHFALLGESLSIIGERLKDVEGQTVSGSLSVLLDSLLCATGPLLCLSQQVPELNCIPQEKLNHLLDNIAYVMPGL